MIATRLPLASLLILSTVAPSLSRAKSEKEMVPADFKIFARYYPARSRRVAWKTTIASDGVAKQEILSGMSLKWHSKKVQTVTPEAVAELVAEVKRSDFFKLQDRYANRIVDSPARVLIVTMDGQTKEVHVWSPSREEAKADIERFLAVWNKVIANVPVPDHGQRRRVRRAQERGKSRTR